VTSFTIYNEISGEILRSGMADRPEWHLREGEAILLGQAASPYGFHVVNGEVVADEVV
jgi:hypothetical protein